MFHPVPPAMRRREEQRVRQEQKYAQQQRAKRQNQPQATMLDDLTGFPGLDPLAAVHRGRRPPQNARPFFQYDPAQFESLLQNDALMDEAEPEAEPQAAATQRPKQRAAQPSSATTERAKQHSSPRGRRKHRKPAAAAQAFVTEATRQPMRIPISDAEDAANLPVTAPAKSPRFKQQEEQQQAITELEAPATPETREPAETPATPTHDCLSPRSTELPASQPVEAQQQQAQDGEPLERDLEDTPEVRAAVDKLASIRKKVEDELVPRLQRLQSTEGEIFEKDFLTVRHLLEQQEDAVDAVDSFGITALRQARKDVGHYIRELLRQVQELRPRVRSTGLV